ncbi:hypothetical protein CAQUA_07040 [Corynebacterium aquatimens]|nr:hypothetical protein CAQUA_07040 [Corynebacterium aquatimens]
MPATEAAANQPAKFYFEKVDEEGSRIGGSEWLNEYRHFEHGVVNDYGETIKVIEIILDREPASKESKKNGYTLAVDEDPREGHILVDASSFENGFNLCKEFSEHESRKLAENCVSRQKNDPSERAERVIFVFVAVFLRPAGGFVKKLKMFRETPARAVSEI